MKYKLKLDEMNSAEKTEKLRRTRIAFWINLLICAITMIIVFKSIDSHILWKIIASLIGFVGFLSLTLMAFRQLIRLQKAD